MAPVVHLALKELEIKYNLDLIETDNALEEWDVKNTPAMMINGDIVFEGKDYNLNKIKSILNNFK